jgi:hypothetical protein
LPTELPALHLEHQWLYNHPIGGLNLLVVGDPFCEPADRDQSAERDDERDDAQRRVSVPWTAPTVVARRDRGADRQRLPVPRGLVPAGAQDHRGDDHRKRDGRPGGQVDPAGDDDHRHPDPAPSRRTADCSRMLSTFPVEKNDDPTAHPNPRKIATSTSEGARRPRRRLTASS